MKVISIINLKGGVGKTFTVFNMAYEIGKRGYKVLVLDNDKQGNVSKAFGCYNPTGISPAAKALRGGMTTAWNLLQKAQYGVDVIPSNMQLMTVTAELAASEGNQIDRYKRLINTPIGNVTPDTIADYYDYMIIDNPPDIALNVVNALAITDEVIVPVKIDEWSLEGLDIISGQIEEAKRIKPDIKLLGALITMYRNDDTNLAGIEWLEKKSPVKMLAKIRYTAKAPESTFFSKAAYEYSPRCGAAQDYKKFVTGYLESEEKSNEGQ